ncbi:MAG: hypothetical protein K2N12_00655 [Helicobacter sp.]|nr:hypothetical protein [Helicobacter sp.]
MVVRTEQELAKAIEGGMNSIEIHGDLARHTIGIKATGQVAWLVAIGAIGVAVASLMVSPATAGVSAGFAAASAAGAVGILGAATTATAISIAVAAGGVGVLNRLRDYDMEKISDTHVKLTKS